MMRLACLLLVICALHGVRAQTLWRSTLQCTPADSALRRSCRAERVCLDPATLEWQVRHRPVHCSFVHQSAHSIAQWARQLFAAEDDDAAELLRALGPVLAHSGSYGSSHSVKMTRYAPQAPPQRSESAPTLLLRAADPMFWHWLVRPLSPTTVTVGC